ncbi:hypothetical protein [Psychrobacillus sp. MER TA 171]|uniref:hypothetical protein n=1 Tax=Psychrobacillus sp. MER TA 171 TaxID=2939577 RepID=UPI002041631C|nr:hypothetical protein [Psychrobacillus sp. MER TA 171]MCM3358095.1 hypothetical protein [Psychrobacillus sp. MER TA 171]
MKTDMELNKWKYKLLNNLLDYADFNLYLNRNLDGVEPYFKQTQMKIINQAHSLFLKFDIEEQTIEAFINCIKEQISLCDKPELYVGLIIMSEDYLLQI